MTVQIDEKIFMATVMPALQSGDAERLAAAVRVRWTPRQVQRLLRHDEVDVRRVAAISLGLIGDDTSIQPLARTLRDADPQVSEMAEHGLWSIWFRLGSAEALEPFQRGLEALSDEQYATAVELFTQANAIDPTFAEPYNQAAIAHYFLGDYRQSLHCACDAVRRMSVHFGAIAGMGHCYAQLGNLDLALRCYRHTLCLNPHIHMIRHAIVRLERSRLESNSASGEFLLDTLSI